MASSDVLIPVFIETSLGTRVAVPISPDIATNDFKREFERVHLNCFPRYGSIKVDGLMVKRKSCHYYLSETLPLKYIFQNSNRTWFLQIELCMQGIGCQIDSIRCNSIEAIGHIPATDSVELGDSLRCIDKNRIKCKSKQSKIKKIQLVETAVLKVPTVYRLPRTRKKRKKQNINDEFGYKPVPLVGNERFSELTTRAKVPWNKHLDPSVIAEALNESISESVSVSVSGIIKKYFSDYDEVASSSIFPFTSVQNTHKQKLNGSKDSKYWHTQPDSVPTPIQIRRNTRLDKPSSEASKSKWKKPEVGKRVLWASNSLGLTSSRERPALSACKFSDKRSMVHKCDSLVRTLVFNMSDEDD